MNIHESHEIIEDFEWAVFDSAPPTVDPDVPDWDAVRAAIAWAKTELRKFDGVHFDMPDIGADTEDDLRELRADITSLRRYLTAVETLWHHQHTHDQALLAAWKSGAPLTVQE